MTKVQAEVPHGGIWVKRASTRLDNLSPAMDKSTIPKQTIENEFYATSYKTNFHMTDNQASTRYNSIEAAGSRIPNSYKLT